VFLDSVIRSSRRAIPDSAFLSDVADNLHVIFFIKNADRSFIQVGLIFFCCSGMGLFLLDTEFRLG